MYVYEEVTIRSQIFKIRQEVEQFMNDIEMPFTSLKDQIDRLKEAVDKCFIPSIYVHTYKIASIVKDIERIDKTEAQKRVMNKLDEQTFKQFERLSTGRCSCKIDKDR